MRGQGKVIVAALAMMPAAGMAAEGPITVWFSDEPANVSDKLANLCADRSAAVVEQDERHVLCQREISGKQGVLAQYLMGNRYSTKPQLMIRFAILRDRKIARVQASQWIEVETAGGQTRRNELNDDKQREQLESTLIAAGAHNVPPELLENSPAKDASTGG
jgi:hypothetical protein